MRKRRKYSKHLNLDDYFEEHMRKGFVKEVVIELDAVETIGKNQLKPILEKIEKTFEELKIHPQVKIILK